MSFFVDLYKVFANIILASPISKFECEWAKEGAREGGREWLREKKGREI